MTAVFMIAGLTLSAPGLKSPPPPPRYDVVHALCVSTTTHLGGRVESTFAVTKDARDFDLERAPRFSVQYANGKQRSWRGITSSTLRLPPFEPGERSYWIVAGVGSGKLTGVDDADFMREHLLSDPYHLIHKLTNDPVKGDHGQYFPGESTTFLLASAVRSCIKPGSTPEIRDDWLRQLRENKDDDKAIAAYVEWLAARAK